jgi:hypothetical protein
VCSGHVRLSLSLSIDFAPRVGGGQTCSWDRWAADAVGWDECPSFEILLESAVIQRENCAPRKKSVRLCADFNLFLNLFFRSRLDTCCVWSG